VHLLSDSVGFADRDKELTDIQAVDTVVFADHCATDIIQIQCSHNVQSGAATRCFYDGFPTFRHPSVSQLRALRRVHAINEQDGFITDITFQLVIGFHERLLCFGTELMWHTGWFFVTEVIAVQPLVQARNGVADTPPFIDQLNDSLRSGEKVIRQIGDKFGCLLLVEMAIRTAIFGLKFFVIKPVVEMATYRGFHQYAGIVQSCELTSLQQNAARNTQHATDPVTDLTVTTLAMLCLKSTFLFSGQVYFHGSEHDLHRLGEQAPSTITGIYNSC
jgi:hypothetical protein